MSQTTSTDRILVQQDERGVCTITLNRSSHRNAFDRAMLDRIVHTFETIEKERTARVVVLKGDGPVFCSGGDLQWMRSCGQMEEHDRTLNAAAIDHLFSMINRCPCPTVAVVQGAALGGGVGLVAACDFVLTTATTFFGTSEATVGIIPACLAPFLLNKVGYSQAMRMFLSGEKISAGEAYRIGLVSEVLAEENQLKAAEQRLVDQLFKASPVAQATAKKLLQSLVQNNPSDTVFGREDVVRVLVESWASEHGQEGMAAFLEKRLPSWRL